MEQQPRPLPDIPDGGELAMLVESDFAEDGEEGSRIDARRRVKKAGCSLRRRVTGGGRTDQDADGFELIAYKETDDQGNVSFGDLPPGEYKINIQYPGIPMDPESDILFTIEEGEENASFSAEVTIREEGISVELEKALGFFRNYFKDLAVYPNPADKQLKISYKKLLSENVSVRLVTLTGKTIAEKEIRKGYNQQETLDVSEIENGIYLLYFFDRAKDKGDLSLYKVVINH